MKVNEFVLIKLELLPVIGALKTLQQTPKTSRIRSMESLYNNERAIASRHEILRVPDVQSDCSPTGLPRQTQKPNIRRYKY